MTWQEEAIRKAREYLNERVEIVEANKIPEPNEVPFSGRVFRIEYMLTMFIDIRKSTDLLYQNKAPTAGRVHKAFLHLCIKALKECGGQVRSVNGDSILAFWFCRQQDAVQAAQDAAMHIVGCSNALKGDFSRFGDFDFGIGMDLGEVFVARGGTARNDSDNDLIFLGRTVNRAVHIGNQAKGPSRIEVTPIVHQNLRDNQRKDPKTGQDMWTDGNIMYRGGKEATKCCGWYYPVS